MNVTGRVAVVGMGIALYVALCLFGYVVLAVYCDLMGSLPGAMVGGVGCVLYCLLISGLRGMPGWALGNVFIGVFLALMFKATRPIQRRGLQYALNAVFSVLITAVGILLIKSLTEVVLYAQPLWARMAKNVYAFVADSVVLIVSLPLCMNMERILKTIPWDAGEKAA